MATKTITLGKSASSGNYIQAKIVCYSSADNDTNKSDVTCKLYVRKDNDSMTLTIPTSGTWSYSLTINGKAFSGTVSKDVLLDWVLIATHSVSGIAHDSDGSKSIAISGSVTAPTGTTLSGHKSSGSGTAEMDTVPRASTIDSVSCASSYMNGKLTYKYTPQSNSFYNRCNISLNLDGEYIAVKSINLGQKSAAQQTASVTLSEDEQATIYKKLPSAKKGTLRFTFRTYSDSGYSNQVGDTKYKEITLYVPKIESTLPDPGATLAPVHSLGTAFDGLYVQGKSKVKASFDGEGKYGAGIKSYSMTVEGETYDSGDDYTSEYMSGYGKTDVVVAATDSREYTGKETHSIYVLAYAKPKIMAASGEDAIICTRCDKNGNVTDSGTYLKIKARRSYSKCVDEDGTQHNFCLIRYRYKPEDGSYSSWKTLLAKDSLSSNTIDSGALLAGALNAKTTYIVQVGVLDDLGGYQNAVFTIGTEEVYMHRTRRGLGIGMYVQDDYMVDIAEDWDVRIRGGLEVGGRSTVASLKVGVALPSGADLNDYKTPGNYYSSNADISANLSNTPYSGGGFNLQVHELQSVNYIRQTMRYGRTTWLRHWNSSEWSDWARFLMTDTDNSHAVDFVVEEGTKNGWTYKKWKSGTYDMFGYFTVSPTVAGEANGNLYYSEQFALPAPFDIDSAVVSGSALSWFIVISGGQASTDPEKNVAFRLFRPTAFEAGISINVRLQVTGKYI